MDKYNIQLVVFRFIMNTINNPELEADPLTAELANHLLFDRFNRTQKVEISKSAVYNLYMYHSDELTAKMVTEEVTAVMYALYDNGEWTGRYNRPSLIDIAARRRQELGSTRPVLKLS